jgi:hypothetical protein
MLRNLAPRKLVRRVLHCCRTSMSEPWRDIQDFQGGGDAGGANAGRRHRRPLSIMKFWPQQQRCRGFALSCLILPYSYISQISKIPNMHLIILVYNRCLDASSVRSSPSTCHPLSSQSSVFRFLSVFDHGPSSKQHTRAGLEGPKGEEEEEAGAPRALLYCRTPEAPMRQFDLQRRLLRYSALQKVSWLLHFPTRKNRVAENTDVGNGQWALGIDAGEWASGRVSGCTR